MLQSGIFSWTIPSQNLIAHQYFFWTISRFICYVKKSTPANCHATDRNYVLKRCSSSNPSSSRRRWKQHAFYPNWRAPSLVLTDHFWWPCTGVMSRASISNLFRNYRKSFSSRLNGAHAELQPLTNNRGSCWVINVLCALLCAVARGLVPGSLISTSFQEIDWYKQSDLIVIYYVIFWKAQGRRFFFGVRTTDFLCSQWRAARGQRRPLLVC